MKIEIVSIREPFKSNGAWTNIGCLDIRIEEAQTIVVIRNVFIKKKEDALIAALPSVQIEGSWCPIVSFGQEQDKILKKAILSAYTDRVTQLSAQTATEEVHEASQTLERFDPRVMEIPF